MEGFMMPSRDLGRRVIAAETCRLTTRFFREVRAGLTILAVIAISGLAIADWSPVRAQGLGPFERSSAKEMLESAKDDLKKNYYDAGFHGIDIDATFKAAEEKMKQATTRDQLMIAIGQALLGLNDSHTFFLPPSRAAKFEYGWTMQMVGDKAYVKAVKPHSDAEAKGLKPGDAILSVDGYRPGRENIWRMYYRYYGLMPARSIHLTIQSPSDSQPRDIEAMAKIEPGQAVTQLQELFVRYLREEWDIYHDRFYESGNDLMIWQMPTFGVSEGHVDALMGRARKFKALVLDLRGNGGGSVNALLRLLGYFFDHDVQVAIPKGRKESKPLVAKTRGSDGFKGQLVVLVDDDSASASELFARVIQLEKRGTIIGDRTAGAVMEAKHYNHQTGVGRILYFGTSVTVADAIMSDGKSLERVGVTPDELLLPKGADMAAKRDPVLSRAAALVGVKLDPEKAGALFPPDWKNQ
jgi:C-terminal processing protease CtpA/Prc